MSNQRRRSLSGMVRIATVSAITLLVIATLASGPTATAQGPGRGPISAPRDVELEKQSYRNLEVAKFYYFKRKPEKNDREGWQRINKAVESRLMEIVDTNPGFARMDEVMFMLGEVHHRGGDIESAREDWESVVRNYPESQFSEKARKRLESVRPEARK